jgi:hypothetical protein
VSAQLEKFFALENQESEKLYPDGEACHLKRKPQTS